MWIRVDQILWVVFVVIWFVASFGMKRTVRRESRMGRVLYMFPCMIGAFAIIQGPRLSRLGWGFAWDSDALGIVGCVLTVAGTAFACWARFTIGRNWSSTVTVKEDHRLIQTGPYRLVRHPIYSGIVLGMLGTAISEGSAISLVGVGMMLLGFRLKWGIEEQFMREQFGDEYDRYRSRVKAVIPGVL